MHIHTISDPAELATQLATRIITSLPSHKKGVLLLSGGSCVPFEVALSLLLPDMKNLHVTLVDERFGKASHPDSNWTQLAEVGFDFDKFSSHPILLADANANAVTKNADTLLRSLLSESHYTIAILGMGLDTHTAGLLPHSPALHSDDFYTFYETQQYHRLTMTPHVFNQIDYALVYTAGEDKRTLLETVVAAGTIEDQPIQLIQQCRQFDIYNVVKES